MLVPALVLVPVMPAPVPAQSPIVSSPGMPWLTKSSDVASREELEGLEG